MKPAPYAYFVDADQQSPNSVRSCLAEVELSDAWLRIVGLNVAGRELIMLELFDVNTGAPLDVPGLGQALAAAERWAVFLAVDPTARGGAFEVFQAGEQSYAWGGVWENFEDGEGKTGRQAFERVFAVKTGLKWDELVQAAAMPPRFSDVADGQTELLLRGRLLGIPEGMPRHPQLFRLHYVAAVEPEAERSAGGTGGANKTEAAEGLTDGGHSDAPNQQWVTEPLHAGERMLLLMLDPTMRRFLWEEAPAAQVTAFLTAIEPIRAGLLGPLASALPDAISMVRAQDPERPLATAPLTELLVYEIISMATAVGYLAGDTLDYYDACFFPLLNLVDAPLSPEAVKASLDEIRELDVLRAMVEVLPYFAPEGELLESFGDEEMRPLAEWAVEDGVYEGSLFLLDGRRMAQRVAEYKPNDLKERIDAFRKVWADVLPAGNQWHAGEDELDQLELSRFHHTVGELQMLLALGELNGLQPAILFYGD